MNQIENHFFENRKTQLWTGVVANFGIVLVAANSLPTYAPRKVLFYGKSEIQHAPKTHVFVEYPF
jgi:hypothetical protein